MEEKPGRFHDAIVGGELGSPICNGGGKTLQSHTEKKGDLTEEMVRFLLWRSLPKSEDGCGPRGSSEYTQGGKRGERGPASQVGVRQLQ